MITAKLALSDLTIARVADYAAAHGIGFDAALSLAVVLSPLDAQMFGVLRTGRRVTEQVTA